MTADSDYERIVVDIRSNHQTGVSRYGVAIAAELLRQRSDLALNVLCSPDQSIELEARVGKSDHITVIETTPAFDRQDDDVLEICHGAALYYTTNYVYDLRLRCPVIFTIHDLTRILLPDGSMTRELFITKYGATEWNRTLAGYASSSAGDGSDAFTEYFRDLNRNLLQCASAVAVVSEATLSDLLSLFLDCEAPVALVPGAADSAFFWPRPLDEQTRVRERHGLDRPFLLWVGLAGRHKRWDWLREVWSRHSHGLHGLQLVTVGGHVREGVDDQAIGIRHLGRVDDADLAVLYSASVALVSASLKEGNNLPPKEAALCGTDRILTDIPSFRETVGPDALYYEPASEDQLLAAISVAYRRRNNRPRNTNETRGWAVSAAVVAAMFDKFIATESRRCA